MKVWQFGPGVQEFMASVEIQAPFQLTQNLKHLFKNVLTNFFLHTGVMYWDNDISPFFNDKEKKRK